MEPLKHQASKKKLRINDIAEELQVKKFVVKQWEKEFNLGSSLYSAQDLDFFKKVKELVYDQKMPITQVKEVLADHLVRPALQVAQEHVAHAATMTDEPALADVLEAATEQVVAVDLAAEIVEAVAEVLVDQILQAEAAQAVAQQHEEELVCAAAEVVGLELQPQVAEVIQAAQAPVEAVATEATASEVLVAAPAEELIQAATKDSSAEQDHFYDELSFFKQELVKFKRLLGA